MHTGKVLSTFPGGSVIACNECGFSHVYPLPSTEAVNQFYETQFYQEEKPDYFENAKRDETWHQWHFKRKLSLIDPHLKETGLEKSLLDIGSGPGIFLRFLLDRKWQALGVEPSPAAVKFTQEQGCDVVCSCLDDALVDRFQNEYSVLHLANVLEHVIDPKAVLERCYKLLPERGLLYLQVPNDYNQLQQTAQQTTVIDSWWVAPKHHINYFNFESLANLATSCGFEERERTTTFPMEFFLLMGDDYTQNTKLGRQCHEKRMAFEQAFQREGKGSQLWIDQFYRSLAALGEGREVILLLEKKSNK